MNASYKSKLAYLDKLHDQLFPDLVVDIYRDELGTYIEFSSSCVRVPAGWDGDCHVGKAAVAYYSPDGEFVYKLSS